MQRLPRWLRAFGPALLYMLLIWALSSFPIQVDFSRVPLRDKGVHFIEYGTLSVLLTHAIRTTAPQRHPLAVWATAVLITLVWGAIDEIHQAFVPGRFSDVGDLIADGCGAVVGSLVYLLIRRGRRSAQRQLNHPS
ncbi:MAG TPA: VanZ family protein [Polyangiales bacterium]|nr:VanZ family protein [Polyangiales bacterium]